MTTRTKKLVWNNVELAKDVNRPMKDQKDRAEAYMRYGRDMTTGIISFDCQRDYTQEVTQMRRLLD